MTDVKHGDLFKSNDPREVSPRVVRVLAIDSDQRSAVVETVEHWDETRIGKKRRVRLTRLEGTEHQQRGYTKVSR